eukprot:SAG31_NODE_604_length_13629_cov_11.035994_1_plen_162_part_00
MGSSRGAYFDEATVFGGTGGSRHQVCENSLRQRCRFKFERKTKLMTIDTHSMYLCFLPALAAQPRLAQMKFYEHSQNQPEITNAVLAEIIVAGVEALLAGAEKDLPMQEPPPKAALESIERQTYATLGYQCILFVFRYMLHAEWQHSSDCADVLPITLETA